MTSSYEANYHKITTLTDLPLDQPRAFRAAGATVVLRRDADGVHATDESSRVTLPVRVDNGEVWVCIDACLP